MKQEMKIRLILLASCLVYGVLYLPAMADFIQDRDALLDFISNMEYTTDLNWDRSIPTCGGWKGVTCSEDGSRVTGVQLPDEGLQGVVPVDSIGRVTAIEILDLRLNNLSGSFPADLLMLKNLTSLHLESNYFQGLLPQDFSPWKHVQVLNLSNNSFNGSIPSSVSEMSTLKEFDLSNNSLSGGVPDFNIPGMHYLNLSNNKLTGSVPSSLRRFPQSTFLGNNMSLSPLASVSPPPDKLDRPKFNKLVLVGISIGCFAVVTLFIAVVTIFVKRKKINDRSSSTALKPRQKPIKKIVSTVLNDSSNVRFFGESNLVFDLEDLLMASADILGKGDFGVTYRAVLHDSTTIVVKRLKEFIIGKTKDFEQKMQAIGNIRHDNVAPLRGYYCCKDEKLMIYDYYSLGCLSSLLHGKGEGHNSLLSWEARLKIAIGAARGLAHIHSQHGGKLIHGNVKASNILITSQKHGCISDVGLATMMSPIAPSALDAAGYCAPEVVENKKLSMAGDVYSFGVVLLEILTGKSPAILVKGGGKRMHLVTWVQAVLQEEWTGEVFDEELPRDRGIEEETVAMLQVGLSCVAMMAEQRPGMDEVVKMLENVSNRPGIGNWSSSIETRMQGSSRSLIRREGESESFHRL